jgi:beta-glucosidase
MCSYNRIRRVWSCENPETLQRDLKERLGFEGWVMSDWGATHSTSINAGLDQEMPGAGWMGARLTAAVHAGNVSLAKVDDSARRILTPMFAVGLFDAPNTNTKLNNVTSPEHNALARSLAARSVVLLKNDARSDQDDQPAAGHAGARWPLHAPSPPLPL